MKATDILQEDDLSWLIRFKETAEDDNSYDTPKPALKRLIEIGVIRSIGFGRCETTSFGDWLIEKHFDQSPTLPLKTQADLLTHNKELNAFKREVNEVLQSVNTTKQLLEIWPSAEAYIPAHIQDPDKGMRLPALHISRLEERLNGGAQ